MKRLKIALILSLACLMACSSQKKACCSSEESELSNVKEQKEGQKKQLIPRRGGVIYKTSKDYSNKVPVSLNRSHTGIAGYPSPYDLGDTRPIKLDKGYCYYANGINSNTTFLNIDYDAYKNLKENLNLEYLQTILIKEQPVFLEMYLCPDVPVNPSKSLLNKKVNTGFKNCKKIK